MEKTVRYPIGEQSFERLREGGFIYVDKTPFIQKIVDGSQYYFLVRTAKYVYIMELKYNGTAEEALAQIDRKEYALPWAIDNRTVVEIGINYSTEKRRIDDWKIS